MRLLCFFILLIIAVVKIYAVTFIESGDEKPITCDHEPATISASHIAANKDPTWKYDFFHPIEVCATGKGLANIKPCSHKHSSHVTLEVKTKGADKAVNINFNFSAEKLLASSPGATQTFCHLFHGFEILPDFKGVDLTGALIGAHAVIFGNRQDTTIDSTTKASLYSAPYYFDKPGSLEVIKEKHKHHEVVCNYENCKVDAKGDFIPHAVERFNKKQGQAPDYVKGDKPLTADMFSVTVFECKAKDKCPTSFTATRTGSTSGFNTSIHLIIGSAIVAVLTSQF